LYYGPLIILYTLHYTFELLNSSAPEGLHVSRPDPFTKSLDSSLIVEWYRCRVINCRVNKVVLSTGVAYANNQNVRSSNFIPLQLTCTHSWAEVSYLVVWPPMPSKWRRNGRCFVHSLNKNIYKHSILVTVHRGFKRKKLAKIHLLYFLFTVDKCKYIYIIRYIYVKSNPTSSVVNLATFSHLILLI